MDFPPPTHTEVSAPATRRRRRALAYGPGTRPSRRAAKQCKESRCPAADTIFTEKRGCERPLLDIELVRMSTKLLPWVRVIVLCLPLLLTGYVAVSWCGCGCVAGGFDDSCCGSGGAHDVTAMSVDSRGDCCAVVAQPESPLAYAPPLPTIEAPAAIALPVHRRLPRPTHVVRAADDAAPHLSFPSPAPSGPRAPPLT